ncbi:hypothetical protein B0H13DRAFT_2661583 [Mycena leptocephala]|nr:hypothetical protein B0H13DRAFT_2661583 [Mycena leptocephala]
MALIHMDRRAHERQMQVVLGSSSNPAPGRTLDQIYSHVGNYVGMQANRMAHCWGRGPTATSHRIEAFFGTGHQRVAKLDALEGCLWLEEECSKLLKYTLPCVTLLSILDFVGLESRRCETARTQVATFKCIITIATRYHGTRRLFLKSKHLRRAGNTEALISADALPQCLGSIDTESGDLSVIERLLIASESSASSIPDALAQRYLVGVLELPSFGKKARAEPLLPTSSALATGPDIKNIIPDPAPDALDVLTMANNDTEIHKPYPRTIAVPVPKLACAALLRPPRYLSPVCRPVVLSEQNVDGPANLLAEGNTAAIWALEDSGPPGGESAGSFPNPFGGSQTLFNVLSPNPSWDHGSPIVASDLEDVETGRPVDPHHEQDKINADSDPNGNNNTRRNANWAQVRPPSPPPVVQSLMVAGQNSLPPPPISFARRRAEQLGGKRKPADIISSPDSVTTAPPSPPPVVQSLTPRQRNNSTSAVPSLTHPAPNAASTRSPPAASVPIASTLVPPTPMSPHHPGYSGDKSAFLAPFRDHTLIQNLTQQQDKLNETVETMVERKLGGMRAEMAGWQDRDTQSTLESENGSPAPFDTRRLSLSATRLDPPRQTFESSSQRSSFNNIHSPPQGFRENRENPHPHSSPSLHAKIINSHPPERPALPRQSSHTGPSERDRGGSPQQDSRRNSVIMSSPDAS